MSNLKEPRYSDDRMSLAQEIWEGLRVRGYPTPKREDMAGPDLITYVFMALDGKSKPSSVENES